MSERVAANNVMDANAETVRPFVGKGIGFFRRMGHSTWDDYSFVKVDLGDIEVMPGVPVMLERSTSEVRVRRTGKVIRVRWQPSEEEARLLASVSAEEARAYFVHHYLKPQGSLPALGAAAVIAQKLSNVKS